MSKMLEMHTNLMRPATVQSAFEQARAASTAHNFKIRSRFSPTFACDRHFLAMNSMTRDCGHNCSGTATQLPRDEREVNFFHAARRELPGQIEMCEIILCHYQAAACFLIKPMNNARPFLAADAGKIFTMRQQGINQCAAFPSSARMNRNSRRFVYNNQVVVFEQNEERDLFWDQVNWLNRWFHHGNAVTRVNDVACARRTAIYRHATRPRCRAETFAQRSGPRIRQSIAAGGPDHRFGQSSACSPGVFLRTRSRSILSRDGTGRPRDA